VNCCGFEGFPGLVLVRLACLLPVACEFLSAGAVFLFLVVLLGKSQW